MSDVVKWKAHGPVRSIRKEIAEWNSDHNAWQAPRGLTVVTFRPDGQFSESECHNPDGSVFRQARVYDDSGRVIDEQSWTNDGPRSRVIYSYDAAGRPAAAVEVASDGTRRETETCRYDEVGRKTKVTFLAAPGANVEVAYGVEGTEHGYGAPGATTSTAIYDDRELPAEVSFHDATQALVRRIVLSRDRDGRLLTEVVHFGGGTPVPNSPIDLNSVPPDERAQVATLLANVFADQTFCSTTYAYDQKGRLIERTRRMGRLSEERTTFRYDDRDNPIVEMSEDRNRGMGMDDDGVVKIKEEEPRLQHLRFDYKYDANSNWIERVVWHRIGSRPDFQRSNVERRTIAYYGV